MNNEPLVSVIIPCYNAELYIEETLQSLTEISYKNWECIVVNDGSTDNSEEVIVKFCDNDKRFKYFRQSNAGPSVARNYAISKSVGEYILPLDADDLISKTYIEEAVNIIHNNKEIKLVYCNAEMFGLLNQKWNLPNYSFPELLKENMIFSTALYRKSDYDNTRGYDPKFKLGREDWDFWLELLKSGGEVHKLEGIHFFYRIHETSRDKKALQSLAALRMQIYQNHRELYLDFIENPIQLLAEHVYYKRKYNKIRKLTFRKPIL